MEQNFKRRHPSRCMSRRILAGLLAFSVASTVFGQTEWPWLKYTLVTDGLSFATHITHAGDGSGRLFVVELAGKIRVFNQASGFLVTEPFLDLSGRVYPRDEDERGLWSVAFPP